MLITNLAAAPTISPVAAIYVVTEGEHIGRELQQGVLCYAVMAEGNSVVPMVFNSAKGTIVSAYSVNQVEIDGENINVKFSELR